MFNKTIFDITKGISSLYITNKKRKHSEITKLKSNNNKSISKKFKDLKDKFKDLESLYDEIEDELQDVHFMNLSDLKNYKRRKGINNGKYTSINNYKNFNYYYNNLDDNYYNLYKIITHKKQKTSKNEENEKEENKKKNKQNLYNIGEKISLKFCDKKFDEIKLGSNENNDIDNGKIISIDDNENRNTTNTNNNENNNIDNNNDNDNNKNNCIKDDNNNANNNDNNDNNENNNNDNNNNDDDNDNNNDNRNDNKISNNINTNNAEKLKKFNHSMKFKRAKNNKRYSNSSRNNNFIPSGIKIPKILLNSKELNSEINNEDNINNDKNENKNLNENLNEKQNVNKISSLLSLIEHLSLKNVNKRSTNSLFNNFSSANSSNSDTIKSSDRRTGRRNRKKHNFSPLFKISQSIKVSKSQLLEDLKDYLGKSNDEDNNIYSTSSKLNTIPYNSFQSNELLNIMNDNKSNYLKLYRSRSIKTSDSDFLLCSSSESIKDKLNYIFNKNINLKNNYYQINNEYFNGEESDPFLNTSDFSESSAEKEKNKSNINKSKKHENQSNSHINERQNKRTRNNSNLSIISNDTSISTITSETTTTINSNITIENDSYQDDITYTELINNPMKKYEIYQMEKSHNQFMKSWLDFENKVYKNLNSFIKNDFIDLYDFLCKKSDTINSNDNKDNEIPIP